MSKQNNGLMVLNEFQMIRIIQQPHACKLWREDWGAKIEEFVNREK